MNSRELVALIRSASADELEQLLERYGQDPRKGVQQALAAAQARAARQQAETERMDALYRCLDSEPPGALVVGIDEVGRGALAGPLLVAAVVLPAKPRILGLDDSKRLTPAKREQLAAQVRDLALHTALAPVEPGQIDRLGMAMALRQAVAAALASLDIEPDAVLLDGTPLKAHPRERAIVGGDASEAPIAAASVLAKVTRDAWMSEADSSYPGYGFASNKGYASQQHIAALRSLGLSPIHRASFCQGLLNAQERLF